MEYKHIKEFCERFNKAAESIFNTDYEFLEVWKLELAKALILDFGEETMSDVSRYF